MIEVEPTDTYYDLDARPMNALELSIREAAKLVARRVNLAVEVKGWKPLWPPGIERGKLRAQCPSSPHIKPVVVEAEP